MKKAIVTGGSRGIGAATVKKLSRDGYLVAFLYEKNEKAAETVADATGAKAFRCDLSDTEQVRNTAAAILQWLGGCDLIVCNAGISRIAPVQDVSAEEFRRMNDVMLTGHYALVREVLSSMIGKKNGRIVFVGSMWGKTGASCEVAYSTAKAGMRGLTMSLSKELGPSGITVNCVEPGVILTDMNGNLTEEVLSELREQTPVARLGKPEEVASLIAFLASDDAGFITGQCIGIDGGFAV